MFVVLQICLACHESSLHEENLLPSRLCPRFLIDDSLSVVVDLVANGHVAHDPSVHVHASCLYNNSFGTLMRLSMAKDRQSNGILTYCVQALVLLQHRFGKFPLPFSSLY